MSIQTATEEYESWLSEHVALVASDIKRKHESMANPGTAFPFFRATFYRWARKFPKLCPALADAPRVLAVGDLHVQNFGTWRDADGRLVWGVNDFDEAFELPYTNDLVRLAASAALASREEGRGQGTDEICDAVRRGYAAGLRARLEGRARPVLLEGHPWLDRLRPTHHPARFWRHLHELTLARRPVPREALLAIKSALPSPDIEVRVGPRVAGMGSLGRPRYCAVGDWHGGPLAREAKAWVPSACAWANSAKPNPPEQISKLLSEIVRAPDPAFRVHSGWVVRRLAPDCDKIDEASGEREARLLRLMGVETANVHGGNADALRAVLKDLGARPADWLRSAVKEMLRCVREDWDAWRQAETG
jgi:hypothetical protein